MTTQTMSRTFATRERFRADIQAGLLRAIADNVTNVGRLRTLNGNEAVDGIPVVTSAALDRALRAMFDEPLPPVSERAAEVRTDAVVTVWSKCPNCKLHLAIPVSLTSQLVMEAGVGELKVKGKSKGRIHTCGQMTIDEPNGQLTAFESDGIGSRESMPGSFEDVDDDDPDDASDDVADAQQAVRVAVESLAEPAEDADAPTPIKGRKRKAKTMGEVGVDPAVEAAAAAVADQVVEAGEAIAKTLPEVGDVLAGDALLPEDVPLQCVGSNHVPGHTAGCPKWVAPCGAAFGNGYTCTLAPHGDDVAHDDLPF